MAAAASDVAGGFDGQAWDADAPGFFAALRAGEEGDSRPMVLYVYTDWCGYCRQFEKELLGTAPVKDMLGELIAVRVNPENGAQEKKIAEYYGVSGFPAFFVQGRQSRSMMRVERIVMEGGQPRLMTPDEFIAAVGSAAAR